jgi:hypothetical protein
MIINKSESIFKKIVNAPGIKNIAQAQTSLRLAEILHRYTYAKRNKRMSQAIERYNKCECKKPSSQIHNEINLCKNYWGCYPLHYFRYDLYRDDKQLSEYELLDYIPEFFFYYLFLPFYNKKNRANFMENKNLYEQVFSRLSITQPPTLCKLLNGKIFSSDMKIIEFSYLEKLLQKNVYEKLFVKPADGEGGYGIYIFHLDSNNNYVTKDDLLFNEAFLKRIGKKNDYIIQPGLVQDIEISRLYNHSVNTFRIATENIDGNVRLLCATLRLGRSGTEVDNSAQNGLIVKIDLDSGALNQSATSEQNEYFEDHPDTHFVFKGYKISQWCTVKDFTIESAQKLPQFVYLGWDIALTKNGPVALEINLTFGLDHYQVALGGLRNVFRISDPTYYWRNKGKRI